MLKQYWIERMWIIVFSLFGVYSIFTSSVEVPKFLNYFKSFFIVKNNFIKTLKKAQYKIFPQRKSHNQEQTIDELNK